MAARPLCDCVPVRISRIYVYVWPRIRVDAIMATSGEVGVEGE